MRYVGLTKEEAGKRLLEFGPNALPEERPASGLRIFLSQFANPLVYILITVAVISFVLREYRDAAIIFLTVLLNSVFGFTQEYRTQKTLAALKKIVVPTARVIRDGERREIQAARLVPGDIVVLLMGDRVPADGKVLEAASFFANEAIMTGESEPVERRADDEVIMGTVISWGTATVEVTRIGLKTKLGEIASSIKETEQPPTTLQVRLKKYIRQLIIVAVSLSAALFIVGYLRGIEFWTLVRMTSVLLIAMMPEALLMAVTLILVIAMRKILKRNALIRKLLAVETLGSVTTICTDKTGTLTEGKMRITKLDLPDRARGLATMCLCNNSANSTEIALWEYLVNQKDFAPARFSEDRARLQEIPFASDHKFMATVNCLTPGNGCAIYVKGAPEVVVEMTDLRRAEKDAVLAQVEEWAKEGLRVLALAYRPLRGNAPISVGVGSMPILHFAGIVGLWDPPRPEVREALATAREAGIKIKVVTGDYSHTALKIMDYLGLEVGPDGVLDGRAIDALDDGALKRRVMSVSLFARVTPQQKLRIVTALQSLGEIVTMTGDGVNDAPALKRANIGIVVGTATEVAKETADAILLDSNFKTIVAAVEEGRVVFENIRKAIFYMLANSFAVVSMIIVSILLGWPLPLSIVQILWIHLICDGPQDITLGLEPKEKEVLIEGPKRTGEQILDAPRLFLIFVVSVLNAGSAMFMFWYFGLHNGDLELGRTMAFTVVTLESILFIFPSRSFRKPFWRYENFWKNPWLLVAVVANLVLQITVTYIPATRHLLGLSMLGASHWALQFLIIGAGIMVIEFVKWGQHRLVPPRNGRSAVVGA
jgi:Ca2+-transporting ATPase